MINKNFFNNIYEDITLENLATFKMYMFIMVEVPVIFINIQKNKLSKGSNFSSFIFPSGSKFNKLDLEFNLDGENFRVQFTIRLF